MNRLARIFTFCLMAMVFTTQAQVKLKPSIGIGSLPPDSASICSIPLYTGSFYTSGFAAGDTVPDFTLYDRQGKAFNLATELAKGKPVLLISGAYTCPVFRNRLGDINNIFNTLSSSITTAIINVVEAHPTDPSPYSGTIWITGSNQSQGILFKQPRTYGERKALVDSMLKRMTIDPPILIDGPCNNWWLNYGPAPNNAYLIDTSGVVFSKHGWFNRAPDDIFCDIDSILGISTGSCNRANTGGSFSYSLDADSIDFGPPGSTLEVHGTMRNLSATENVEVHIKKLQKAYPSGWQSALCAVICHAPTEDTTTIFIPPSGSQTFTFYFYTDSIPSSGYCQVGFRNQNHTSNRYVLNHWGRTDSLGLSTIYVSQDEISVFPNPANDWINFSGLADGDAYEFVLQDLSGRMLMRDYISQSGHIAIDRSCIAPGIYVYTLREGSKPLVQGKLLIH